MRWLRRMWWLDRIGLAGGLLALAALVLPELHPDNTLPAGMLLPSADAQARRGRCDTVRLIFIGRQREADGKRVRLEFLLANGTQQPVQYTGCVPRAAWGNIRPLYAKEVNRDGQWSPKPCHCGNGATPMRLQPGHAGKFTACVHENELAVRVGIRYRCQQPDDRIVQDTVWSEDIPFKDGPPDPG